MSYHMNIEPHDWRETEKDQNNMSVAKVDY